MSQYAMENQTASLIDPETGKELIFYFEKITPKIANKLLESNVENNRTVNASHVTRLANQIEGGYFHAATAECLKISDQGKLLDGQHRLKAIIQSNKPQTLLICSGVPHHYMESLDDGSKRDLAAALVISGEKLPSIKHCVTALNTLYTMQRFILSDKAWATIRGGSGYPAPGNAEMLRFHVNLKGFNDSVIEFFSTYQASKIGRYIGIGTAIAMHYLFKKVDSDICRVIFKSFESSHAYDRHGSEGAINQYMIHVQKFRELTGQMPKKQEQLAYFFWIYKKIYLDLATKQVPSYNNINADNIMRDIGVKDFTVAFKRLKF